MKNIYKLIFAVLPLFISCSSDEDEVVQPPAFEAQWYDSVKMRFTPLGEFDGFVYNVNESTGQSFWGETEAEFQIDMDYGDATANIAKIDFYAFVEGKSGDTYTYYGGENGKLLTTINNPENQFVLTVSTDEVYDLYSADLGASRDGALANDDLVELKWTITDSEGNVYDSRVECYGFNCTKGIGTSIKYVDTWLGEFEYTWTEVGPDTETYSHADLVAGSTGVVTFSPGDAEGTSNVDDASVGASFNIHSGYITFDEATGVLRMYNNTTYDHKWTLVSVTPEVLTISWEYYYTQWYAEYGTFELRRDDGLTWPDITTIESYNETGDLL